MYGKKLFLKKEFIFGGTSPDTKIFDINYWLANNQSLANNKFGGFAL